MWVRQPASCSADMHDLSWRRGEWFIGVWRGDLRKRSSLQPQPLDKAIKALIRRKLIKLENSIVVRDTHRALYPLMVRQEVLL